MRPIVLIFLTLKTKLKN
uniref:Uncharacterized protein n=1 Tax=Anguilla anguilla TaxID=7936 RepID=A0A0E9QWA0_ANGAN